MTKIGKLLKYIVIVGSIFIIVFIAFKYFNKSDKLDNKINNNQKVFEDPKTIVYQIKGKEKFTLTKEDEEYREILNKLNSSIIGGYTSREELRNNGEKLLLDIMNINAEIYSKYAVLRLRYNETYEIDIVFKESDELLDIMYVENNMLHDSYNVFNNDTKKEIKEFIDNI